MLNVSRVLILKYLPRECRDRY